jgi:hypothetical protein
MLFIVQGILQGALIHVTVRRKPVHRVIAAQLGSLESARVSPTVKSRSAGIGARPDLAPW